MITIPNTDYPSHEKMIELRKRYLKGDMNAFEEMIVGNQRFVATFATNVAEYNSPEWENAFQAGIIGMMTAVEKWDPKKGQFTTYAATWIRQHTHKQYANTSRTIRLPMHIRSAIKKLLRIATAMQMELGHRPSPEEIAEETGLTARRIGELFQMHAQTESLDAPVFVSSDDDRTRYDSTQDSKTHSPQDIAVLKDDCMQAVAKMKELYEYIVARQKGGANGRNCKVFFNRYGIFGYGPEKTLEEVAKPLRITRERVRQICAKVFRDRAKRKLVPYTEDSMLALIESITTGVELMIGAEQEVPEEVLWIIKNH